MAIKFAVDEETGVKEVDDTDGLDEQAEYEAWKLRELKRIKRDKEEREAREKEQEEIERRRNMSEEQRLAEDMERVKNLREKKPHGQYKFLQKYYHKGAFYLNPDDKIFKRDYTEATPDEAAHKELLPKVMQVKNFGRAGQTKWTHLADQDTSKKDAPWSQSTGVNKSMLSKLGGLHGGFDKPTSKKRRTGPHWAFNTSRLRQGLVETKEGYIDECLYVHGSLARAGKVKSQTPKVEKQEKKKKKTGRAKKRILYNRRFVNVANIGKRRMNPAPTSDKP
ncbi:19656_t:CDS:2 [Dentiscutata erythropus]|uniref:19656_t:CDS:1 n=1 Tax=Dentiscutata erythropus TaxID=1348616 RepID=A0A9N9AWF0_9GLOM|nr:19656_t:CDS:2 [Dentiscutata erythropus]